jgi:hypothetical protein
MIVDLFGPIEGRHADAYLMNASTLLDRLDENPAVRDCQYYWQLYGDQGYGMRQRLCCPYKGIVTPQQAQFNDCMKGCRETIEWMIGKVATLWAWLDWHKTQKVDNAPVASRRVFNKSSFLLL